MARKQWHIAAVLAAICLSAPTAKAAGEKAAANSQRIQADFGKIQLQQASLVLQLHEKSTVILYSASGQVILQMETGLSTEIIPLQGLPYGFLYLNVQNASGEFTKKLVYSGN